MNMPWPKSAGSCSSNSAHLERRPHQVLSPEVTLLCEDHHIALLQRRLLDACVHGFPLALLTGLKVIQCPSKSFRPKAHARH